MSRFKRLVELRNIQEEVEGAKVAAANAKVQNLLNEVARLEQETTQGRNEALEDVDQFDLRLPPQLYEDYFAGQKFRIQHLEEEIQQARQAVKKAMELWHAARVKLRQAEHIDDQAKAKHKKELARLESQEMDQLAAVKHHYKI